jgi:MFS family permease
MTLTYQILFIYDKIGIELAGIYLSLIMITNSVLDYPTGSLSDWIGQKGVLILAHFFHAFGIILFAISTTFVQFAFIGIIFGFFKAQLSGTIESWFDNNYKSFSSSIDPDNKIYSFFQTRLRPIMTVGWIISVLIGGYIATLVSRQVGFILEGILSILFLFTIYFLMNDFSTLEIISTNNNSFYSIIKTSLKFVFKSNEITFLFLGFAINQLAFLLWSEILLFFVYFGYAGSDFGISIIRSFVGILAIPIFILLLGKIVANVKTAWNVCYMSMIQSLFFFGGFYLLIIFVPPRNTFNPTGVVGSIFVFIFSITILNNVIGVLYQQLMLEIVPSDIRNSIYSFQSSLKSLLAIIMIPITTYVFNLFGLFTAFTLIFLVAIIGVIFIFVGSFSRISRLK